ncbi:MAG: glycosyltransferase [Saprospiraceae bacterium]|nr:glycosyltransferase [Saprospiraceae bacterium]
MKILIITLHADPTIPPGAQEGGGTHMYINELINLLIYKQVDSLFITRKASGGSDFFQYGPVKLKRISIGPEGIWDKSNLDNIEEVIKITIDKELQSQGFVPDLIHSVYWHSGRAALHFSEALNVPFIHTIISNGIKKQKSGFEIPPQRIEMEKRIFNSAKFLIAISAQEKENLIKYYGIPENKIKVIGRGVDNIFLKDIYDGNGTLLSKQEPNINTDDSI